MELLKNYLNSLNPIATESWGRIQPLFRERTLEKGSYFIKAGEQASELAFLKEGIVRAYYRSENGIEYNKHFFVAPCFIGGYASLITGLPNSINQQALASCRLSVANYSAFTDLYATCPDLERAARRLAELFFVHKEQREIEIVLLDADKRYLLFQKQFPLLEQLIPQYHIASYLGITPTQLSRIRRKFMSP